MPTGTTIISNALQEIGILAAGETLTTDDGIFGLSKLNRLIGVWRTRKLFVPYALQASFPWATSKQSYTIGPSGADFTAARPTRILAANLVDSSDIRMPLTVIDVQDYADIESPVLAGTPNRIYYQRTVPNGTIWPYPYPDTIADELELFTWAQLDSFATLATDASLADGYEEALTLTLAESLCAPYGRSSTPELAQQARNARAAIQGLNTGAPLVSTVDSGMPNAGAGLSFDILTRSFR